MSLDEKIFVLANIYAPDNAMQQAAFFKKLSKQLEEFAQETIVVEGDFNCALTSKDKKGGISISKTSPVIKEIETLCHLYSLSDIRRNLNPDKQCFTWRTKSFKIQCRLDYFLVSQELTPSAKKCDTPESDHSAVSIHLQFNNLNKKKGPGFRKFNISLLKDEAYVTALKINIQIFKKKYEEIHDLGLKWDLIKMEIRGFTLQYSKRKEKNIEMKKNHYQKK